MMSSSRVVLELLEMTSLPRRVILSAPESKALIATIIFHIADQASLRQCQREMKEVDRVKEKLLRHKKTSACERCSIL